MTLSTTLEAALIGQATKQDVIKAIDAELAGIPLPNWKAGKFPMNRAERVWYLPHRNGNGFVEYCRIENGTFYFAGGWSLSQKEQGIKAVKKSILLTHPAYKELGREFLKGIE